MIGLHKFSSAMAGVGFALLQVASLPLHAAPPVQVAVQILDPSGACASWTQGGTLLAPTLTCVPAAPGAPVCSLTANPPTLSAAGSVMLTATCTNTDISTTWAWTGAGIPSPTTTGTSPQTQTNVPVSATTTFGVTATNAASLSGSASVTVTVGAPPPPPPPPPGGTCMIGTKTFNILDLGLQPFMAPVTTTLFGGSNIAISTLLVPAGYLTTTNTIAIFEYLSPLTTRHAWLSKTRCDQAGGSVLPSWPAYQEGSGPVFNYTIGGSDPAAVKMLPGETWYLHVTNQKFFSSASSCTSGYCNIGIKWYPPN